MDLSLISPLIDLMSAQLNASTKATISVEARAHMNKASAVHRLTLNAVSVMTSAQNSSKMKVCSSSRAPLRLEDAVVSHASLSPHQARKRLFKIVISTKMMRVTTG